jgi:ribonuclease P protein component
VEGKSLQEEGKREGKNSQSLKKANRIKNNSEFKEIFRLGKRKEGENLTLIFVEKEGFKFGITFKKGSKPAVMRNRAKRRLIEIIRKRKDLMVKDIHIVIHLSKTGITLSFDELSTEFNNLLQGAGIAK